MTARILTFLGLFMMLTGCFNDKPVAVAKIGHAGSMSGPHFITDMWVSDVYGGGANFAYGAVQGCCKSASIGIGVPSAIKGEWQQGWRVDFKSKERWRAKWRDEWGAFYETPKNYRIDDVIDSELARQKIETMNHYYKNHKALPVMKVLVDGSKVMVLYAYSCTPEINDDCTVRANSDPNGWVKIAPGHTHKNSTVVVL